MGIYDGRKITKVAVWDRQMPQEIPLGFQGSGCVDIYNENGDHVQLQFLANGHVSVRGWLAENSYSKDNLSGSTETEFDFHAKLGDF